MDHALIGRGKAGWHSSGLDGTNKCSSMGGMLETYLQEAKDGTIVYDAEEVDMKLFIGWVYMGPIFDPMLKPYEVKCFGFGSGSLNKTLLGVPLPEGIEDIEVLEMKEISSFDFVGMDVFLAIIREKLPNVKIGVVNNHNIIWENK